MFERYTENARRAIFFSRFEASQFGSGLIEPEHLLLALLREATGPAYRLLRSLPAAEGIRSAIQGKIAPVEKTSSSVDIPLSPACKRVLAFASEEAERLTNSNIDTEHLLLGILREEKSVAAALLRERGLNLEFVRERTHQSAHSISAGAPVLLIALEKWLAAREASGGEWTIEWRQVGNGISHFAIYRVSEFYENRLRQEDEPAKRFAAIWRRIVSINNELNRAIANHEFEKARSYAEEARNQREVLHQLQVQFGCEALPLPIPFLCVEVIPDDRLSEIQKRCDGYIAQGVDTVWLLNPTLKRAYTVTEAEGLREFKGNVLRSAGAELEMDLKEMFDSANG